MQGPDIPYALFSHHLTLPGKRPKTGGVKIWVCINLMDHRVIGLGCNREEAIEHMLQVAEILTPTPAKNQQSAPARNAATVTLPLPHTTTNHQQPTWELWP